MVPGIGDGARREVDPITRLSRPQLNGRGKPTCGKYNLQTCVQPVKTSGEVESIPLIS